MLETPGPAGAAAQIYGRFIDDCAAAAASFGDGQSNQDLVVDYSVRHR